MSDTVKIILVKALKTFLQTFLSVAAISATGQVDLATVKGGLIAGGAAVLSVLMNALSGWEDKLAQVVAQKAYRSRTLTK